MLKARLTSFLLATAAATSLASCATGYHATSTTGGFEETKLSERMYQVRFQGNGYTSRSRTSQFILRRCAELTLENGFRYFTLGGQGQGAITSGASGFIFSFPHGEAMVRFVDKKDETPETLDSMLIVPQTDQVASGKLSPRARKTFDRIASNAPEPPPPPSTLAPGVKLYTQAGKLVGQVSSLSGDTVTVSLETGGTTIVSRKDAEEMMGFVPKQ